MIRNKNFAVETIPFRHIVVDNFFEKRFYGDLEQTERGKD